MVLDLILPVLAELVTDPIKQYIVTPITRHIGYVFKCSSKVQTLQNEVEQLRNKKDRLQQSVNGAIRNGEEIYPNVTTWLSKVDQAIGDAEELVLHKEEEAKKRCFVGLCPNFNSRYNLSKNADKKASAIHKLRNEEGLDSVSFQIPLQQVLEPSLYTREALPSRVSMLNQIMDALRDPNLNMIGIYGMGGVGKTTLAKEVQAKAVEEKLFETVLLVAVSQTPELRRIQAEIAEFLGLKFEVEELPVRASQLYKRLENSKVLIILDDLWQKLDLYAIGIPSGDASKGCKIGLTSRNMDLLSSEMRAQKLFSLEALKEDETWSLFEKSVPEAKDPKFQSIATQIAKKCAGLPLLIQLVATELQNKESYEWSDKLNQLSALGDEEIYEKVYKVLESSYDNLPGEEIKSFFLLCSLFGQSNIQIQYLLTHSIGLGLFKHIRSIEDARNKVFTLINKLKAKSLLMDGDMVGFVKMHDVVRDTALSIASRVQHAFIGSGEVWPSKECTRISFPYCDVQELPVGLDCPNAEVFLLFTEDLCLEISDSFFEGINKLKVVDFTGMRMVSLPSSIGLLTNLQTLCLHRCRLDNVAMVGELKQLESLSFASSNIVELPREIEALTRLKLLDLSNCRDLKVIFENVLSKLCSLEELYMLNSFVRWNTRGNASLVELDNLSHLLTLEIQIVNSKLIPQKCNFFDQLKSYKISIGDDWGYWSGENYERSRTLKLKVDAGIQLKDGIKVLLSDTEDLYLSEAGGMESILYDLDRKGFPQLKHLHIQNDYGIQHLIKSTMRASCHAFPILESLNLDNLTSLEKICYGPLETVSFGELRILKISCCDKLKRLFSLSSVKCLRQLQEMEVQSCGSLEDIVGQESEDEHYNNEVIEFNQLSSLKLSKLPHLKGFCNINKQFAQPELLFSDMVSFPNLTSLEVRSCGTLKYVFTASMMKHLKELKKVNISDCVLLEEIIQSKKDEEIGQESIDMIEFPKVDSLSFKNLRNMARFGCGYSIEFPLLRELLIEDCGAMKNFMSKFSINESDEEYLFNEMVTFPNLETMKVNNMSFKYLWDEHFTAEDNSFSKLKSLDIENCSKLSVVFPSEACRRFQRLETLLISSCEGLEEIFQYQQQFNLIERNNVQAFSLRVLRIYALPSLKNIWSNNPCGAFAFENLESVDVRNCKDLKYVFPSSIACSLPQLQALEICYCKNVEVIIATEKNERSDPCFLFPDLTKLRLAYMMEMRSLYEGPNIFECPKLKSLEVEQVSNIVIEKFIGNLEELTIDEQVLKAIQQSAEFSVLGNIKKLTLRRLEEESIPVAFAFLRRLKSLEMLILRWCSLEEILLELDNERPIGKEQLHYLTSLKHFELRDVKELKHIVRKKGSQVNHIQQCLHTLNAICCYDLMNIASFSASFQNLTTLRVQHCKNIINLVTASTAKTMVQLMELDVMHCKMIEEIVSKDDGDDIEHDVIIFKKLKRLNILSLPKFKSFCSSSYTFSFPLLEQVSVSDCSKMKIFCRGDLSTPKLRGILYEDEQQWEGNLNDTIASQLREWVGEHIEEVRVFQNVESLQVVKDAFCSKAILANQMPFLNKLRAITVKDCNSVQVVFDLEGISAKEGPVWLLHELSELYLVNLPILSQLCNKNPGGILDFNKLKVLKIEKCSRLEYVFTWSMASCLFHLEEIHLKNCEMMGSIIKEDEVEGAGTSVLEFRLMKKISIHACSSFKSLILRLTREHKDDKEEHDIHFSHKVFPNLKELSLDMKSIVSILPTSFFPEVKKLVLTCSSDTAKSLIPLLHFLSRLPKLDQLEVLHSSLQELFKFGALVSDLEEVTTLPQIRTLNLENLDGLKRIWWPNYQEHVSLFQSLETMKVKSCGNLINLASGSTSFQNLTTLQVCQCNQLVNLLTLSISKSMVQLVSLRVESCKMLVEIVDERNDGTTEEIVFTKMKMLELADLQSLGSFSSLGHCSYTFPCLERIVICNCPNLRVFCRGSISTPLLNCINEDKWMEACHWDGNLGNTLEQIYNEMVGFKGIKDVKLSIFPTLKDKWGGQFPLEYLIQLERLAVDDCAIISNAISSHLLQHLKKLKVLIVENCDLVEQVFDLEGLNAIDCGTKRMKYLNELQLIDLPKLTHVWSKDPQQILSFKNLQLLKVHNCSNLTFIFDLSMALRLPNLQHLEVKNCSLVEHIIAKEEEKVQEHQTIFPSLQCMNLQHLSNLLSFCSASGFLECLSLKMIEVVECPNMELFASAFSSEQDSCMMVEEKDESVCNEFMFLGNKIAIPGLEELKVEWNSLKDILYGDNQPKFLHGLKCIELTGFRDEHYAILPSNFLRHFPKLEKLALSDASIEEVDLQELSIHNGEDASLTKLKLSNLPKLKHLVHDDSQLVPLFQILEGLEVVECSRLKILVPSTVSFQNLTSLEVSKCDGLINLMTPSTARSLVQLKRMNVKDCKMMQEIVAIGSSDGVECEIRFSQLEYLGLNNLPCLGSFCSWNFDFHFPSLKEVIITECPNMKIFAEQVLTTPKLRHVRTGRHEYDDWEWEGTLNNTIQALFLGKDAKETDT